MDAIGNEWSGAIKKSYLVSLLNISLEFFLVDYNQNARTEKKNEKSMKILENVIIGVAGES